jgi:hypothetical protein
VTKPEIGGVFEVSAWCGFSSQRLAVIRREGRFPEPDWTLACGDIWLRSTVSRFLEQWNRTPGRKAASERR